MSKSFVNDIHQRVYVSGNAGEKCAAIFLIVLATLLLLCDVCLAGQPNCGDVRIKAVHPLQFGYLRAKEGASGWFLLEADKEYFTSPSVSVQNDSFPSPGQVEVTAPSGSRLILMITAQKIRNKDRPNENICLKNLKISSRSLAVTKTAPDLYRLDVPKSKNGTDVTFMLNIGGELSLKTASQLINSRFTIYIECSAIT